MVHPYVGKAAECMINPTVHNPLHYWPRHRLLLLKLDKQIGDTINQPYQPILAANEAYQLEGWGGMLEGVGYSTHALLDADFHH